MARPRPAHRKAAAQGPGLAGRLCALPPWALAACAVALVAAVYLRVAGFGFVNLDDTLYVTENPQVLAGLTLDGVRWAFSFGSANYWHPLTWLSLMLDRSLYGDWAGGFHLTNAALHCANVALLFFLVLRWLAPPEVGTPNTDGTSAKLSALAVALLFGLHPAHVESVAWVTERKDMLFAFFGLLALHGYTSYATGRCKSLLPALLAYAASLTAKPMLVTLPALLIILDFWPLGRLAGPRLAAALPALLREKGAFLLLAVAGACTTLFTNPLAYDSAERSLGLKLANAVASYLDYLRLAFFPAGLGVFYPYPVAVHPAKFALAILALCGITVLALRQVRRRPYLLAGWAWFVCALGPVLVPPRGGMHVAFADRWGYFPFIGLYIALVLLSRDGLLSLRDARLRRRLTGALLAGLCALLATLSSVQLGWWKNAFTLYERAIAVTEDNYFIMNNYGVLKMRAGDASGAEKWLRLSLGVRPSYGKALGNMGILYANQGKFVQALPYFEDALKEDVRAGGEAYEDHYGLGFCLAQLGRLDEAEAHYLKALEYKPDYAQAYNDLGNIAMLRGLADIAEKHYSKAVGIAPGYAVAQENLNRARAVLATKATP